MRAVHVTGLWDAHPNADNGGRDLQTEIKPLIKASPGILNGLVDRSISSQSSVFSPLNVQGSGDKMITLTKGVIRLGTMRGHEQTPGSGITRRALGAGGAMLSHWDGARQTPGAFFSAQVMLGEGWWQQQP